MSYCNEVLFIHDNKAELSDAVRKELEEADLSGKVIDKDQTYYTWDWSKDIAFQHTRSYCEDTDEREQVVFIRKGEETDDIEYIGELDTDCGVGIYRYNLYRKDDDFENSVRELTNYIKTHHRGDEALFNLACEVAELQNPEGYRGWSSV